MYGADIATLSVYVRSTNQQETLLWRKHGELFKFLVEDIILIPKGLCSDCVRKIQGSTQLTSMFCLINDVWNYPFRLQ